MCWLDSIGISRQSRHHYKSQPKVGVARALTNNTASRLAPWTAATIHVQRRAGCGLGQGLGSNETAKGRYGVGIAEPRGDSTALAATTTLVVAASQGYARAAARARSTKTTATLVATAGLGYPSRVGCGGVPRRGLRLSFWDVPRGHRGGSRCRHRTVWVAVNVLGYPCHLPGQVA